MKVQQEVGRLNRGSASLPVGRPDFKPGGARHTCPRGSTPRPSARSDDRIVQSGAAQILFSGATRCIQARRIHPGSGTLER